MRCGMPAFFNIATATTLHEAKVLRAAHCDAIVVQGSEAAGPRSSFEDADDTEVGLSSLIPAVAAATKTSGDRCRRALLG